ncbi:MAG TPA: hypothetical protein DCM27_03210 [Rhodospirillaceae bacterium]|nr:hypothetical protein [Rhodospirillaceae bacterium]
MSAQNIDDPDLNHQSSDMEDSSYDEPYEDDAAYSQDDSDEWADDIDLSDEAGAEAEQPPPKKKTSNLTIGIILFVAIIGVFGFMILTGDKNSPPESGVEAQMAMQTNADSPETQDADNNVPQPADNLKTQADQGMQGDGADTTTAAVAPPAKVGQQEGLMGNPDLLTQNPNSVAPQPPVIVPDTQSAPPPLLTETAAPPDIKALDTPPAVQGKDVVAVMTPTVKPVSDFPTVDSIKKPDAATANSVSPVIPTPTVPVAPAVTVPATIADNKSEQLQGQIDKAADKIAMLEKQLADKNSQLDAEKQKSVAIEAAKTAQPEVSDTEVEELKAKIADLERKLAAKVERPAKTAVPEHRVVREGRDSFADSAPVKKPTHIVARQVVTKQWSLQSAGAGKAILADKSTGDLKTVRVGDSVAGLGRITSISTGAAGWIVKGTAGSVTE